jgi:hypothetical protein
MAATTGQLGLVTPTQGTLSGTWGDTVNNGITEYVNIAIAGATTFNGDGAVTLVNTLGSSSATNIASTSAQYMIVRVTGTLTTTKIITFGSVSEAPYSKIYLVDNAATGGAVTFKAYGQTGVSVAVGEKVFVFYNGTDIVKISGTLPTTTVPIANGGTGQTTATAAFDALAPTTTAGDTMYFNGTDVVRLGIGTAGQALVVNTGATAPEWGSAGVSTGKAIAMAMIFGF